MAIPMASLLWPYHKIKLLLLSLLLTCLTFSLLADCGNGSVLFILLFSSLPLLSCKDIKDKNVLY